MKKVFQTKLKSITKVLTLVIIASLATFTGCKSYDEDINSLNTDVTALKSQLASLDTYTKAQIDAKITTLNGEITTLKTSLATLTANGATDAELAALKTDIESRFVTKAALDAYKTQVTTDIAAAVAGLATKASVDAVSTEVVKVQTALSALGVSVDAKILALKTELNAKDAELATAIGAVTARVATLEGLVAANTTGVAANKAAIVALQAELTALKTQDIATINAKLKALDDDLKALGASLKLEFEVFATRQLTGLLFVPQFVDAGFNQVEVGYIFDKETTPAKSLFTQNDVIYRINPTIADLTGTTWKFINNSAVFSAPGVSNARGDAYNTLFADPTPTFKNNFNGSVTLKLKVGTWSEPDLGKTHYFALQSVKTLSDTLSSVVSDYVKVKPKAYTAYIAKSATTLIPWGTTLPGFTVNATDSIYINGAVIDLDDLVFAASNDGTTNRLFTDALANFGVLGTDYKFVYTNVSYVPGAAATPIDNTDQSAFIKINSENKIELLQGTAAIDRTPVVKVELKTIGNKLLATAYIKFKIARKPVLGNTYTYPTTLSVTKDYNKLFVGQATIANNKTPLALTWQQMNEIYAAMGLTHNEFRLAYNVTPTVKVNGVAASITDYPLVVSQQAQNVDSYAMKYEITPLAKFGTTNLEYTFDPGNNGTKLVVKFAYTINKPVLDKTILLGYQVPGLPSDMLTQGTNYGSGYAMQIYLGEGFAYGSTALRALFGIATADKIDGAKHQITFKVGAKPNYQTGASLNGVSIPSSANTTPANYPASLLPVVANGLSLDAVVGTTGQTGTLMALTNPLSDPEKVYNMNFYTYYPNQEKDSTAFNVHFKNPLTIVEISPLNPGFTLTDVITGQVDTLDVAPNYNVMFGNKIAIKGGVTQTANTNTTVKASDFNISVSNLTYAFSTTGYSYAGISLAGGSYAASVLKWINNGTSINTTVPVAKITPTITTPYATFTPAAANEIFVKSSSAPGFVKRK